MPCIRLRSTRVVLGLLFLALPGAGAGEPSRRPLPMGSSLGMPEPRAVLLPAAPQIDIAGAPALGSAAAPVTIVEFIDYECPYCQKFASETFPQLQRDYVDTGKVRYVALDFPLAKHSRARPAAIAAACADEQGRFWEMREALLATGRFGEEQILAQATALGLDPERFRTCRGDGRHEARLDAGIAAARSAGVGGTPSFLVGRSEGTVVRGQLLQGDEDFAAFGKVLAEMGIDSPVR